MGYIFNPTAGGGGGSGITSINSDTTAAQVIAAGAGISVATAAGTTTITNTGSAPNFSDITSGTNTTAAMVVGTGASLTTSGSGTITATAVPFTGITGETAYSVLGNATNATAAPTSLQSLILGTPGYTPAGVNYLQSTVTANSYAQISLQNLSNGASVSSDFIVTADNGDDTTHYADFGMNGSGGAAAPFTTANAAYLYTVDNELNIAATGSTGVINIYTTGGSSPVLAAKFGAAQQLTLSGNGAASLSPFLLNGTTFSGGSGTTTLPKFLIQPTAATPATTWSVNGTQIAVNSATGFTGTFIDFRVNGGSSVFNVNSSGSVVAGVGTFTGNVSVNNFTAGASANMSWSGRSIMNSSANGTITMTNQAATGFTLLQLGPTVAAPTIVTLQNGSVVTGTTDTAGANFIIASSQGTGTGAGGSLVFQTAPAGSTGTSQNALVTALTITSTGAATFLNTVNMGTLVTNNWNNSNNTVTIWQGAASSNNATFSVAAANPLMRFAGSTSSFPAIKRSGTVLGFRLADDSADAGITASTVTFSGIVTSQSGQVVAERVVTAAGAITVATTDYVIVVNKTVGAATTVNLMATPTTGTVLVIKDGKGDAATNNITITPNAGNIDGAASIVLNTNYQSATISYNGTQWNVI